MDGPPQVDVQADYVATRNSPLLPQTEIDYRNSLSLAGDQSREVCYYRSSEEPVLGEIIDYPIMGGIVSKETAQSDLTHQLPKRKHTMFRRRSKSLPPRPPTFVLPRQSTSPLKRTVSDHPQAFAEQPTQGSQDPPNPPPTEQDPESQRPSIQTVPSSPPYDEDEKSVIDDRRTKTPMLRLPTPSLMPEESPGKYGMDVEPTPLRNNEYNEQPIPRARPKSGTGAQIFQVRCPSFASLRRQY